jgi:hypothetical protein
MGLPAAVFGYLFIGNRTKNFSPPWRKAEIQGVIFDFFQRAGVFFQDDNKKVIKKYASRRKGEGG